MFYDNVRGGKNTEKKNKYEQFEIIYKYNNSGIFIEIYYKNDISRIYTFNNSEQLSQYIEKETVTMVMFYLDVYIDDDNEERLEQACEIIKLFHQYLPNKILNLDQDDYKKLMDGCLNEFPDEHNLSEELKDIYTCSNTEDFISLEDIDPKEYHKKGHIIIIPVQTEKKEEKGVCYNKSSLLKFMKNQVVYGPYPHNTNTYHKLPYPGIWIDQEGFEKIGKSKVLKLKKLREEPVGTSFGISQLHGAIESIYTLNEI
jgi:transposase